MFARGNADYIAAKYTLLVYEIHESYHNQQPQKALSAFVVMM